MAVCRVECLPQSSDDSASPPGSSFQQSQLLALDGNALANLEVGILTCRCLLGLCCWLHLQRFWVLMPAMQIGLSIKYLQ